MFSFNDGKIHDEVKIIGDFPSVKLDRLANTTQYVASHSSSIKSLRHNNVQYQFLVDGQARPVQFNDYQKFKPEKLLWQGTPYLRSAPEGTADTLILVIPGNPGLCEYYGELVEALARLVPNAEVVSISYLGYNVDSFEGSNGVIGLDCQVDHKLQFLQYIHGRMPRPVKRTAVLGHSVGAWVAQRVATRFKEVGFVGLLTPTVRNIALSERGEKFTQAAKYVGPLGVYYSIWALRVLPFSSRLVTRVVSRMLPQDVVSEEAREASIKLSRNPHVLYQVVAMANEEMQRIDDAVEPEDIKGFWDQPRIWGCFATNDHWVSEVTRDSLFEYSRQKPNVRMEVLGIPHAFCLRHSEAVAGLAARQILDWISPGAGVS